MDKMVKRFIEMVKPSSIFSQIKLRKIDNAVNELKEVVNP
jgi:hypothetical protein